MTKSAYQKHQEKIENRDPLIRAWNNRMKRIAKQRNRFQWDNKPISVSKPIPTTKSKWASKIQPLPKF